MRFHLNAARRSATGTAAAPARAFHRGLDGYAETALRDAPQLARELGVRRVWLKDETKRLGLPAFKVLGAAWAAHRALEAVEGDATLITATDGNHGRAIAHVARLLGVAAHVLVPAGTAAARIAAIRAEGAHVEVVAGSYDEAVACAAALAGEVSPAGGAQASPARGRGTRVLVQDTAWPGYAEIPEWIVQGYDTLFHEVEFQVAGVGGAVPDVVVVPVGVGSLMSAALRHADARETGHTSVVSVETDSAPCVLASLKAGRNLALPTSATAVEALNAGTISSIAWPAIRDGVDAAVMVSDEMAARAQARLHEFGVPAGICGGASLAGIAHLLGGGDPGAPWSVDSSSTVVIVSTDGS